MRVTANQVTYLRLLLLPLPVWLMYHGFPDDRAIALVSLAAYVLLGLTDALDGWLARRHGSTPIGALLDPIADKIFLIAAYVPMADVGLVTFFPVLILFVRELAVTALRSVAIEEGFAFKTSAAAKLKTTVQMAGAGMILLIRLFPAAEVIGPILGVAFAGSLIPGIVVLARGRRPGWMPISAALLFGIAGLTRVLWDPLEAARAIMVIIIGFTVWTGLEYLWGMRAVLAARIRRRPVEAVRLLALAAVLPGLFLRALDRGGAPTVTILVLVAAEIACGGVDNFLVQVGRPRGPWPDLARALVQAACGVAVFFALDTSQLHPSIARFAAQAALIATLADLASRLLRQRDAFR
jgi:CDP-diacylglycerol--glycerol-3-phosphate 3-phosphatidyltransferase